MDLFSKTMKPAEQVLKNAGFKKEDIRKVLFQQSFVANLAQMFFRLSLPVVLRAYFGKEREV